VIHCSGSAYGVQPIRHLSHHQHPIYVHVGAAIPSHRRGGGWGGVSIVPSLHCHYISAAYPTPIPSPHRGEECLRGPTYQAFIPTIVPTESYLSGIHPIHSAYGVHPIRHLSHHQHPIYVHAGAAIPSHRRGGGWGGVSIVPSLHCHYISAAYPTPIPSPHRGGECLRSPSYQAFFPSPWG